jgi:hypothetical protein
MWVPVVQNLIRWAGLVGIAYLLYKSAAVLAGRTTDANFAVKFLASKYAGYALMALFGGSSVLYGLGQRKLRRDTVERISPRTAALEKKLDRKRSSSKLTKRGDTNPGDAV